MPFVQNSRFGRLLQRLTGVTGNVSLENVHALAPVIELIPGDFLELAALREEFWFSKSFIVPAVAGSPSVLELANVPQSGRIAVVEHFMLHNPATTFTFRISLLSSVLSPATVSTPLDGRVKAGGAMQASQSNVSIGGSNDYLGVVAAADLTDSHGFRCVLQPGRAVVVETLLPLNIELRATLIWREFVATTAELTLG